MEHRIGVEGRIVESAMLGDLDEDSGKHQSLTITFVGGTQLLVDAHETGPLDWSVRTLVSS